MIHAHAATGFLLASLLLQDARPPETRPSAPPPAGATRGPDDGASVESIVAALYDVISGPSGQKRDWDRMRQLFLPQGRLVAVVPGREGGLRHVIMTVDDYAKRSGPMLEKNGFFEREAASKVERYGAIAHVWSSYESRHRADEPAPFARGVNSIQLVREGERWWILSVLWDSERPAPTSQPAK